MISEKYISALQKMIRKYFPEKEYKVFIFGSSLERDKFRDVDVGIIGKIPTLQRADLEQELEESDYPYIVDLVDMNDAAKEFKNSIFQHKLLWI